MPLSKDELRKLFFQKVKKWNQETSDSEKKKILDQLQKNIETFFQVKRNSFDTNKYIMIYRPFRSEPPIIQLTNFLPYPKAFPEIYGKQLLPVDEQGNKIPTANIQAVIVPALFISEQGERLGRGGGYYDRFLPTLPKNVLKIFAGYSWQILPTLPTEPWDMPVDVVITEKEIRKITSNEN